MSTDAIYDDSSSCRQASESARDFPTLVSLYRQGRLPLERFVTERITLEGVEAAFKAMHAGTVLRSVVVL